MLYPTINQYIDALGDARNTSRSLGDVDFCTAITGDPIFDSGNFGVVFKVRFGAQTSALKCFTRHQSNRRQTYEKLSVQLPRSSYLINIEWLSEELWIAPYGSDRLMPFDVVRMEFIEGQTLAETIAQAAKKGDRQMFIELSKKFDQLALWLLDQQFAHGDIKPENIIVDLYGKLKLVDYDGFFLPSMQGETQREIGADTFQHPLRHSMILSRDIDDYPLALLCLSLRVLAVDVSLYGARNSGNNELLIYPADAITGRSPVLDLIEIQKLVDPDLIACIRSPYPHLPQLASIIGRKQPIKVELHDIYPIAGCNGWGFAALNGEVVVSQIYDAVRNFECGLAAVCMNKKWGFIDDCGDIIVPLRYDRVWDFTVEGLALVKLIEKYGFVNYKGRVVIKVAFDYAVSFSEGLAVAAIDGKYGYIDTKGLWIISPQYSFAHSFRGGEAQVELDGQWLTITR